MHLKVQFIANRRCVFLENRMNMLTFSTQRARYDQSPYESDHEPRDDDDNEIGNHSKQTDVSEDHEEHDGLVIVSNTFVLKVFNHF